MPIHRITNADRTLEKHTRNNILCRRRLTKPELENKEGVYNKPKCILPGKYTTKAVLVFATPEGGRI